MKRITLEEVRQAYLETKLIPKRGKLQGRTLVGDKLVGCGLGVLCYKGIPNYQPIAGNPGNSMKYLIEDLGYDKRYLDGFVVGFDNSWTDTYDKVPEFIQGFEDGKSIGLSIFNDTELFGETP